MNVLVTGAGGFVGRALCAQLAAGGFRVRGTVRGREPVRDITGITSVATGPLEKFTGWASLLDDTEVVVHLASAAHGAVKGAGNSISELRKINVDVTHDLADAACGAGVRRLVYISSVKVNGEGREEPYTEQDDPAPEDAYGMTKHEAERALVKIGREAGLEVVILRPPLVYGPGVKANFLKLLKLVDRGIPLPLANVKNRRSFIFIENLVDAVIACVENPKAAGRTYLVSDGEDVSTAGLIRRMADALGRPARLFPLPGRILRLAGGLTGQQESVKRLLGSLTVSTDRIKEELGWSPPCAMTDGLKKTAKWYRRESGRKPWTC